MIEIQFQVQATTKSNENQNSDYNIKTMTKLSNANVDFKLLKDCTIIDAAELDLKDQLGPDISMAVDNYLSKLVVVGSRATSGFGFGPSKMCSIIHLSFLFDNQKCAR
jgi:hypothetical protein